MKKAALRSPSYWTLLEDVETTATAAATNEDESLSRIILDWNEQTNLTPLSLSLSLSAHHWRSRTLQIFVSQPFSLLHHLSLSF